MTKTTQTPQCKPYPAGQAWPFKKVSDGFTTVRPNEGLFGVEILFKENPGIYVVDSLRANGFRWSPKTKLWWAKQNNDRVKFAMSLLKK